MLLRADINGVSLGKSGKNAVLVVKTNRLCQVPGFWVLLQGKRGKNTSQTVKIFYRNEKVGDFP